MTLDIAVKEFDTNNANAIHDTQMWMVSNGNIQCDDIRHSTPQTTAQHTDRQNSLPNRIARDGNRARGPASEKVQEVVLIGGGALVPAEVLPLLLGELAVLVAEENALALRILITPVDLDEVVAVFGHLENARGFGNFSAGVSLAAVEDFHVKNRAVDFVGVLVEVVVRPRGVGGVASLDGVVMLLDAHFKLLQRLADVSGGDVVLGAGDAVHLVHDGRLLPNVAVLQVRATSRRALADVRVILGPHNVLDKDATTRGELHVNANFSGDLAHAGDEINVVEVDAADVVETLAPGDGGGGRFLDLPVVLAAKARAFAPGHFR